MLPMSEALLTTSLAHACTGFACITLQRQQAAASTSLYIDPAKGKAAGEELGF